MTDKKLVSVKGFPRSFEPLKILTEGQVEAIHKSTLEVLRVAGVRIDHPRALELFEQNGCKVDHEGARVRIPPDLVEECIRQCPSSYLVKARDPQNNLMLGGDSLYFEPSPGMQTVDLNNWEPRDASRKEYYDGVTVLDALPYVHGLLHYTPYFGFKDVPPAMSIIEGFAAQLRNSTKATFIVGKPPLDGIRFCIDMANAVGNEVGTGSITSPPPVLLPRCG
ncbi:trimethylamine methyltransferase family protein [Chloroflexota bacterium]